MKKTLLLLLVTIMYAVPAFSQNMDKPHDEYGWCLLP